MRRPCPTSTAPEAPRGGWLYVVRFTDTTGRTVSELFRTRPAAERYAELITDRGGAPAVYRTLLHGWEAP